MTRYTGQRDAAGTAFKGDSSARSGLPSKTQRFKHTPGPWSMWTSNSYRRISSDATGKDGDVVCAVVHPSDGHPDLHFSNGGFNGPDARLMLAAPALLAALDYVIRDLELRSNFKRGSQKGVVDIGDGAYMQAKAALAAATGRALEAPSSANQQMDPESSAALATQGVQLAGGLE